MTSSGLGSKAKAQLIERFLGKKVGAERAGVGAPTVHAVSRSNVPEAFTRFDRHPGYEKMLVPKVAANRLGDDAGVMAAVQSGNTDVAQILERTPSGRVSKVRIGSKTFSGMAIREKLELRSTNFTVDRKGDNLIFKTMGYGHGVGLCQYGANGIAKEGRDYRHILTYYYTGVAIKNIHGS